MAEPGASPQFSTAEYAPKSGDICRSCNQAIGGQYYRLNGAMTCPACADSVRRGMPRNTAGAFGKAFLAGAVAAVAGLILYAAVGIITGWMIGYVSLAVGYIVGHAMMKASGGIGGRRYQVTALIFTYAAVSLAAIPIYISQAMKDDKQVAERTSQPSASAQAPSGNAAQPATTTTVPSTSTSPVAASQAQPSSARAVISRRRTTQSFIGAWAIVVLRSSFPVPGTRGPSSRHDRIGYPHGRAAHGVEHHRWRAQSCSRWAIR